MSDRYSRELKIVNERGLHARASAKVVEIAEGYDCTCWLAYDGETAEAASIMDLLGLAAPNGATVSATAEGPDALAFLEALEALIGNRFGEER